VRHWLTQQSNCGSCEPHAKCGIPMQYEPPPMDISCLPKAASPTSTSHIVNRKVLMLALTAVFSLATAATPAQVTATLDPQSTSDSIKSDAMHNEAVLQGTMHSDAPHKDSMQSDRVRSDSDAAHANSPSY
jgi:pentapeptide MXKDX repeat protein